MGPIVNLMSDTQTRPTAGMRRAIAEAEVGDEQLGLDPTVNRLCARVAEMLGYEAALFAPSGTMCNQIGVLLHCSPGDEAICDASSHVVNTEGAGAAALAGVALRAIETETGIMSVEQVEGAVRGRTFTGPRSRLLVAEQTVNFRGGRVWPVEQLRAVAASAKMRGLSAHLDGARLLNACVASGTAPDEHCAKAGFDTAWIDLSKGLGCPVGAVLCGSRDAIEAAWRWKYRLGGAMRQAGVLAAAGLYALDHHVDRLADDHGRAKALAVELESRVCGLVDVAAVETNIVLIDARPLGVDAATLAGACRHRGVLFSVIGPQVMRAITHLDVDDGDVARAVDVLSRLAGSGSDVIVREAEAAPPLRSYN